MHPDKLPAARPKGALTALEQAEHALELATYELAEIERARNAIARRQRTMASLIAQAAALLRTRKRGLFPPATPSSSPVPAAKAPPADLPMPADRSYWCVSHQQAANHLTRSGQRVCNPATPGLLGPCNVLSPSQNPNQAQPCTKPR